MTLLSLVLAACSGSPRQPIGSSDASTIDFATILAGSDGAASPTDLGPDEPPALVYAHSATTLYTIDPDTLVLAEVADFQWPTFVPDTVTDIALDKNGKMIGISSKVIYSIDPATAKCTYIAFFSGDGFNGLSFIADANGGTEKLVGASQDGSVYAIDPTNGNQTHLGSYGSGWGSSGDIVSVKGATYATVRTLADAGMTTDTLVTVDPSTGTATKIGDTGVSAIYGLGYWKQKVFGFTASDGIVTIDITTGHATSVPSSQSVTWYGAGVTTAAPTTID